MRRRVRLATLDRSTLLRSNAGHYAVGWERRALVEELERWAAFGEYHVFS